MLSKILSDLLAHTKHIDYSYTYQDNIICLVCKSSEQWELSRYVLALFTNYPITLGDVSETLTTIEIYETLPTVKVKGLLPMLLTEDLPF